MRFVIYQLGTKDQGTAFTVRRLHSRRLVMDTTTLVIILLLILLLGGGGWYGRGRWY